MIEDAVHFSRYSSNEVIPSIETDCDDPSGGSYTDNSVHSRTPSISLTPTPSSSTQQSPEASRSANARGTVVFRGGDGVTGVDGRLRNMRLSSQGSKFDMSDVDSALERVARGSDSSVVLLDPGSPGAKEVSSGREMSRRRRSSSRANLVPHDVKDEEPPEDRFHKPAFQQAFYDAKTLMSELADVLGSSALHFEPDSTMQRLHKQAGELARFHCPSSRTVGFVGDSGVGKSLRRAIKVKKLTSACI